MGTILQEKFRTPATDANMRSAMTTFVHLDASRHMVSDEIHRQFTNYIPIESSHRAESEKI